MPKELRESGSRVSMALLALVLAIPLFGCNYCQGAADRQVEDAQREMAISLGKDPPEENLSADLPNNDEIAEELSLAAGDVFMVRLHFGGALADTPDASYKVRIENPRNGWYDYVEHTGYLGLGGSDAPENNYTNANFGSTNFNKQITQTEYYDPKDIKGEYTLTITSSAGYRSDRTISWDGSTFTPATLSISVP